MLYQEEARLADELMHRRPLGTMPVLVRGSLAGMRELHSEPQGSLAGGLWRLRTGGGGAPRAAGVIGGGNHQIYAGGGADRFGSSSSRLGGSDSSGRWPWWRPSPSESVDRGGGGSSSSRSSNRSGGITAQLPTTPQYSSSNRPAMVLNRSHGNFGQLQHAALPQDLSHAGTAGRHQGTADAAAVGTLEERPTSHHHRRRNRGTRPRHSRSPARAAERPSGEERPREHRSPLPPPFARWHEPGLPRWVLQTGSAAMPQQAPSGSGAWHMAAQESMQRIPASGWDEEQGYREPIGKQAGRAPPHQ